MPKRWEYNEKYNSYSLYCYTFLGTWEPGERRPIAVLNVERRGKKERYTYSCYVVLRPGSLIPLKAKSINEAKSKIEKGIIEYLEYKLDEHLVEIRVLNKEIEELKREENEVCKM